MPPTVGPAARIAVPGAAAIAPAAPAAGETSAPSAQPGQVSVGWTPKSAGIAAGQAAAAAAKAGRPDASAREAKRFIDTPAFKALPADIQKKANAAMVNLAGTGFTPTVGTLVTSPAFAKLDRARQDRQLNVAGATGFTIP